MKTFNCKKCGTILNAGQDECPVCGAIYYVLRDETPEPDDSDVNVYVPGATSFQTGKASGGQAAQNMAQDPYEPIIPAENQNQQYRQPDWKPIQPGDSDMEHTRPIPDMRQQPRQPEQRRENNPQPGRGEPMRQEPMRQAPKQPPQPPRQRQQFPQQPPQQRQPNPNNRQRRPAPQDEYPRRKPPRRGYDTEDEYYDYPPEDGGGRKKGIIVVAGFIVVAVIALIVLVSSFSDKKDEPIPMPDLVGMMKDEAAEELDELGIRYKFENEDSSEPKDTVIKQSFKKDKRVKKDERVVLTVSTGEEEEDDDDKEVLAPNLVGMSYEEARKKIIELDLMPSLGTAENSSYPENQVIRQDPAYNSPMKKGDSITIVLSKGAEATPSPSPSPTPEPGFSISVISAKGGSVSPSGSVSVKQGESKTFTISADSGYEIKEVKIDGVNVGAVSSYTFNNVQGDHTVYVVFQLRAEPTPTPTPVPTPTPTPVPTPDPTPVPTPEAPQSQEADISPTDN